MIFDQFAGFIEKNLAQRLSVLEQAHLFEFPYQAHKVIKKGMFSQQDLDDFLLPFPTVAVEDGTSCVFIRDSVANQFGCEQPRDFIDVVPMGLEAEQFASAAAGISAEMRQQARAEGLHQAVFGTLHDFHLEPTRKIDYQVQANIHRLVLFDKHGRIRTDISGDQLKAFPSFQEANRGVIGNVLTAIEELLLAQKDRQLFVLEKTPVKPRNVGKGRILRSHDRARYVLLQPDAIRKLLQCDQASPGTTEGKTKAPHERRRHWRTLRSERFTEKRGQRVLIPAVWVGPEQAVVGKVRYKVRLDV